MEPSDPIHRQGAEDLERVRSSRHTALTGKDEVIGDPADAMLTYTTCPIVYKSFS